MLEDKADTIVHYTQFLFFTPYIMEPWEFPANVCSKTPSACTHPHPKWMTYFWALIYINRPVQPKN